MIRSNHTPWMDEITLISVTKTDDDDGYVTETETTREVFCTFAQGINRTEFYEGLKAGVSLSASVELWQDDYENETVCEFDNVRYNVVRVYETGKGTVELSLSEVIR